MESTPRYRIWSDGKGNYDAGQNRGKAHSGLPQVSTSTPMPPVKHPKRDVEDFGELLDLVADLKDQVIDLQEQSEQQRADIEALRDHVAHLTEALGARAPAAHGINVEPFNVPEAA